MRARFLRGHYLNAKTTEDQKFWRNVVKGDGCWKWTGYTANGYGRMRNDSKKWVAAHRFSYEKHCGSIPTGLLVCHRCDNPLCVNPAHLFVGTYKDNSQDMVAKGRFVQNYGRAKLSESQVKKLLQLRRKGARTTDLGKMFGITQSHASKISRGLSWRGVT